MKLPTSASSRCLQILKSGTRKEELITPRDQFAEDLRAPADSQPDGTAGCNSASCSAAPNQTKQRDFFDLMNT